MISRKNTPAPARVTAPKQVAKPRIVVADDNNEILQVVRLLLEPKGYEVVTLKKNVFECVKAEHPNLLLLDVLMSGEDGRIITKNIKASRALRDIPVILFSAKQNLAQIAADAGADGFLEKPFESRNLYSMIERHARTGK